MEARERGNCWRLRRAKGRKERKERNGTERKRRRRKKKRKIITFHVPHVLQNKIRVNVRPKLFLDETDLAGNFRGRHIQKIKIRAQLPFWNSRLERRRKERVADWEGQEGTGQGGKNRKDRRRGRNRKG
jgi:hypothetical protein